jgi:H+/Cl- antiporter ClcA
MPSISKKKLKVQLVFWLLCILISLLIGLASAAFLLSLDWVTQERIRHSQWIYFLPLAGFAIGYVYHYWGESFNKGNNHLIDEFHLPQKGIPVKMGVFIFGSTLLTHLVGGSAGREGTAMQMGGAIAYPFRRYLAFIPNASSFLLVIGISAGFAAVFGTPWAATLFALEVIWVGKKWYKYILPSIVAAFMAHESCLFFGAEHTLFPKPSLPNFTFSIILGMAAAAVLFGLTARLFTFSLDLVQTKIKRLIAYPPFRPAAGGLILLALFLIFNLQEFAGLGMQGILQAFDYTQSFEQAALKLAITALTLGSGFKGGEVTPLFFIGASLGSALSLFLPLPVIFLAAMGFVAVFSGASNAPLACAIMGMELFGWQLGLCFLSINLIGYFFAGETGIYSAQKTLIPKIKVPLLMQVFSK